MHVARAERASHFEVIVPGEGSVYSGHSDIDASATYGHYVSKGQEVALYVDGEEFERYMPDPQEELEVSRMRSHLQRLDRDLGRRQNPIASDFFTFDDALRAARLSGATHIDRDPSLHAELYHVYGHVLGEGNQWLEMYVEQPLFSAHGRWHLGAPKPIDKIPAGVIALARLSQNPIASAGGISFDRFLDAVRECAHHNHVPDDVAEDLIEQSAAALFDVWAREPSWRAGCREGLERIYSKWYRTLNENPVDRHHYLVQAHIQGQPPHDFHVIGRGVGVSPWYDDLDQAKADASKLGTRWDVVRIYVQDRYTRDFVEAIAVRPIENPWVCRGCGWVDPDAGLAENPLKVTSDSHVDHALTDKHLAFIIREFGDREAFFLETVEMPADLPSLPCALHGPIMGDPPVPESDVTYVVRGSRPGPSRMCRCPTRMVRTMTVIGGPDDSGQMILYTAYGGPSAPREPWDPGLNETQRQQSEKFWSEHALSMPESHVENPIENPPELSPGHPHKGYYRRRYYFDDIFNMLVEQYGFTESRANRALDVVREELQDYYNKSIPAWQAADVVAKYYAG